MTCRGTLRGSQQQAVRSRAARLCSAKMKFESGSGIAPRSLAGSMIEERAREDSKNRLRNDYLSLAARRRARHRLCDGIAYRDRSARTQLDQSVRCRSAARKRLGGAYAGSRGAGRGGARIYDLHDAIGFGPPHPARHNPPARAFRPWPGQDQRLQHPAVLGRSSSR